MSAAGEPAPSRVQSLDRGLLLVELLAQAGGRLPISHLAERSGLPLGTTHRLLATLAARGFVRQEPDRRYALGPALLAVGHASARALASGASPWLARLAERCGESANLAMLEDDHVVYVAQAAGRHRMRMFTEVGRSVLPHSTAVGKVLLAWQPLAETRRVLARHGLPRRTARTITSERAFLAELATVRGQGWAVDDEEEEEGVRCLAVPVGAAADAVLAVSVSAPASRLATGDRKVLAALRDAAAGLAGLSGGGPTQQGRSAARSGVSAGRKTISDRGSGTRPWGGKVPPAPAAGGPSR